jgi:hypothetical protein
MEQLYLEQMIVKPMPKKQVAINVKMGDAKKKEEPEKNPRKQVEIVDKRDEMNINIDMVLDRMNKQNIFDVRVLEPPTKSVIMGDEVRIIRKPEKQTQKLVIGEDVEPEPESEKEEKEEEPEPEKEPEEEKEPEPEPEKEEEPEPEKEEEPVKGEKKERKKRALKAPKVKRTIDTEITEEIKNFKMGTHTIEQRLPKPEKIIMKTSSFYMNNRRIFIQKLREMFKDYTKELDSTKESISCSKSNNSEFGLMTHQKIVRDYLNLYSPYRGLLIYHGLGAGKCMKKGTPIIMSNGEIKLVENIEVGDLLMGDDSKPRTVLSLARGRDKMYEIIPVKGDKYTVNQEHILCLRASGFPRVTYKNYTDNTSYNIQWIENNKFCSKTFTFNKTNELEMKSNAEMFFEKIQNNPQTSDNVYEIAVKDYLNLPKSKKAIFKGYKVPIEFPEKELPIDPYMIGYWLGDGSSDNAALTSQDSTVLYYFANNLPKYGLSLNYHDGYTYGITGNGKYHNNVFINTLKSLNLFSNKHIPMIYKCNSRENRLKLLAGLLDSDGCLCKNGGFEFTQKNEKLMDDVIYLARSLGFSCYKAEKQTSWTYNGVKKYGTAFRSHINGKGIEEIPTLIPRKKAPPRKQIKDVLVTGITVKYVGEDDYYGFMLDGNCRYMIGDFTVTHNTCTSIALAEGMKSGKSIVVMTPASLKMNFFSELKKCGDPLYKKNQYWEFISTEGKPEYIDILENVLSIPREVFEKNRGAWMVDVTKASNFADLSSSDQESIDEQLNLMIRNKYIDINYNGLTKNKMDALTDDGKVNPFDNKVVIIDEAHNFVSRIVNKIKKPASISFKLYDYLMKATNARVILLTGTPIINYPNEIGILFNILRGSIKTWSFPVTVKSGGKVNKEEILQMFDKENFKNYDYVEYSDNKVVITRNPFGFVNTKKRGPYTKKNGGSITTMMTSLFGGKQEKEDKKEAKSEKRTTKKIKERKNITKKDRKHRKNKDDEEPYTIEKGVIKINYRPEEVIEDDAKVDVLDRVAPEYHKGGDGEFEKYNGVKLDEHGNLTDDDFVKEVKRILNKNKLEVIDGLIEVKYNKALPDDAETFLSMFVDIETGKMKNENTFKKRILGLTSYFRSAQEKLLPAFVKTTENKTIHVVPVEMSEHQFSSYLKIRKTEIDQEKESRKNAKKQAKKGDEEDIYKISSTYRIFSRAACNFTFPNSIERPLPDKPIEDVNEEEFDVVPKELLIEGDLDIDKETIEKMEAESVNYKKRIDAALEMLAYDPNKSEDEEQFLSKEGLAKYSPKFLKLLENIQNEENKGLHLIYSQFRTIEGIGILKLILEANGYAEFKIKKDISTDKWEIIEKEDAAGKPRFVLYTGTETADEKEIIRNIYNSAWNLVPPEIVDKIKEKSSNNFYGEIIKLFLITSSGAEGINLKNTRFVHIVEPYWHNVRVDQVVGRARRICSHEDLPEELRTVEIFLYLSVFTEKQKTDKNSIEIMIHDISKIDQTSITTDQSLYEIAQIKDNINQKILKSIKETSIDCNVYNTKKSKGNDDEQLICYGSNFGKLESNDFISYPTLEKDTSEKEELNIVQQKITLKDTKEINGVKYKVDPKTNILYDKELFDNNKQLVKVGELKKVGNKVLVELNK